MKIWAINILFSHSVSSGLARMTSNSLGFSTLKIIFKTFGAFVSPWPNFSLSFFSFFFLASSIQGLLAPVDCLISHTLCHHVITPAEGFLLKQQPQRQTVVLRKAHLAEGDIQRYHDATCIYV